MRVCLYSHDFWPSVGGLEASSELLAGYLSQAGIDVVVATQTPLGSRRPRPAPYEVVRSPRRRELVDLLRTCDLVHASCMSFAIVAAARRARVPLVLTHSSFSPEMHRDLRTPRTFLAREEAWRILHARASKIGMRLAAQNICVSYASFRELAPPRGAVLHLPIAIGSLFRPMPEVKQTDRFAFFGRLVVHKGCDVLLRAIAHCRERGHRLGVDVYGEGPDRARLARMARRYKLDDGAVAFHGFVHGEELARAYNRAFAVVAPSLWQEPFGMVAVEAMACGRAVLASEEGGLGELVTGRGLTFRPGDAEALARRLIELRESPGVLAACEESGPGFARRFGAERTGRKYLAVYRAVAAEFGKGPVATVATLRA